MNRTWIACLLSILLCAAIAASGSTREPVTAEANSGDLDAHEYRGLLLDIGSSLEKISGTPELASKLADSLPHSWTIHSAQGTVQVDAGPLSWDLREYATTEKPEALEAAQARLRRMEADAEDFSRPMPSTNAAAQLKRILSRREFHGVQAQSPIEAWKDRLLRWILKLLGRGLEHTPNTPIAGRILLWSLLGLTVAMAGVLLWKVLLRAARDTASLGDLTPNDAPSAKPWRQWLAEAEAAAQRGDLRDAIHLGYWASISYLEASGNWRPDRARTPREYLSLLPEQSARREPLTELTWCFENTWYGNRAASEQDFSFAMAQLERLGCR